MGRALSILSRSFDVQAFSIFSCAYLTSQVRSLDPKIKAIASMALSIVKGKQYLYSYDIYILEISSPMAKQRWLTSTPQLSTAHMC
jgi:hypothetical protein